uniref:Uncharacterized protein n=1 Tax=Tetranychus urticae TaxID=32264 RepID=T1JUL6_TETUR
MKSYFYYHRPRLLVNLDELLYFLASQDTPIQ